MRETCEIFECKFQSLARWVDRYEKQKDIKRKTRKSKKLKITPEIEQFVKTHIKKHSTATLWELSGLIDEKFKVKLSDMSVYSILNNLNISRKRVRSKYYPGKIEEQEDINEFYKKLEKYKYDKTICLDEKSIYLNMVLPYRRSKKGTRVIKKTNKYPFIRYNLLCAISANKVKQLDLEYNKLSKKNDNLNEESIAEKMKNQKEIYNKIVKK